MEVGSSTSRANSVAYYNGHVYTVDDNQPWAQAFIVTETGVFEAVGSDETILAIAKIRKLVQYDLRQTFVMPGIHDAHSHMFLASIMHLSEPMVDLEANDPKIAEKLRDGHCSCSYTGEREDWVVGNTYQSFNFPDGKPDRIHLDHMWPDRPVILREFSAHKLLMNTAAMRRLGIDRSTPDPAGGYYVRRKDGELTGEAVETATEIVWSALPTPPMSHVKRVLKHAVSVCHRYGITSSQEATANTFYLHALHEIEQQNQLDLDVYTHIVSAPGGIVQESEDSLATLIDIAEGFRGKHIHPNFIKFILDGSPIPPHLTQADLDEDGKTCNKNLVVSREKLFARLRVFDRRGLTCKIHAAGQGSARMALDVIQEVRELNGDGPRHEIAHCNSVHPEDIPRFASLKVTAEMSPAIFHYNFWAETPHLGSWNFNGMLSSNALMTIGSDWIVTPTPDLFPALAGIVEKVNGWKDDEAPIQDNLTDKQRGGRLLCRAITMGGACAVGAQHRTGSIQVGKKANFIAVDKDLSAGEFEGAQVLKTWFEGRIVYTNRFDGYPRL